MQSWPFAECIPSDIRELYELCELLNAAFFNLEDYLAAPIKTYEFNPNG